MRPAREVLPNGLVVLAAEHHDVETVAISVQCHAGSRFDAPGREGLAQMTGSLLRDGTARHSKEEIAEEFDLVGADAGSGAGRYTSAVSARMLARDLERLLPLIAEMVREPSFPEASIAVRRGEMLTAIDEHEQDPRSVSGLLLRRLLYPDGHPLAHPVYGTRESVGSLTAQEIAAFHEAHVGPQGSSVVLVGDFELAEALGLVRAQFGSWSSAALPPSPLPSAPRLAETRVEAREVPGTFQVEVALGSPGIARSHPDFYALELVNHVLGEFGMGGRLGARVREEHGLAYAIGSSFDAGLAAGPFVVSAGVDPAHVAQAVEDIRFELRRMRDEGPSAAEIDRSRRALARGFPLRLETQAGIAAYLQHVELHGLDLDYADRYQSLLDAVTLEQARRAAAEHLSPDCYALAVAGPGPFALP